MPLNKETLSPRLRTGHEATGSGPVDAEEAGEQGGGGGGGGVAAEGGRVT